VRVPDSISGVTGHLPRYFLRVDPQRLARNGPGQGKRDRVPPREGDGRRHVLTTGISASREISVYVAARSARHMCRFSRCRWLRHARLGSRLRRLDRRCGGHEGKPHPFLILMIGGRRARRGGETGGQSRGERRSCLFPRGGGQRVACGCGGDGQAGERVARDAGGAGLRDAVRDGGEGLGGDGDREVAGTGDLDSCDPLLAGELRGQALRRFSGVLAEGEGDAGGVLARGARRAQAGIGGPPQPGGGDRIGDRTPQVPGDHVLRLRGFSWSRAADGVSAARDRRRQCLANSST